MRQAFLLLRVNISVMWVFFFFFFCLLNYTHFTVKMIFRISGGIILTTYIYR